MLINIHEEKLDIQGLVVSNYKLRKILSSQNAIILFIENFSIWYYSMLQVSLSATGFLPRLGEFNTPELLICIFSMQLSAGGRVHKRNNVTALF